MKRLLVNDMLSALPGNKTFWHDLMEWFGCEFWGIKSCGECSELGACVRRELDARITRGEELPSLIIRNATYWTAFDSWKKPVISLLQDIITEGPLREMQEAVIRSSSVVVFNSAYTASKYLTVDFPAHHVTIPLPVDFSTFEPGNPMGLQQALGLPDGCVCWIGACREAGYIKGWDTFIQIARMNPDMHFVAVLKDAMPESVPPNVRCYVRLPQDELARVIGACRVGLCTSRMESQHLAGIEMGACGLPMVAPPVGVYYQRTDMPGFVVADGNYAPALRAAIAQVGKQDEIRAYWRKSFDKPVIKKAWMKLVEEVECSNQP